jgi:hypothetical protein
MKMTKKVLWPALMLFCSCTHATWLTTSPNNDYSVSLDNGVVYISHPQFVAPCLNGRVEIRDAAPYSNDYTKRLISAIFMAKASGKYVAFTWNDTTGPNCLLNSVSISN